MSFWKRLIRLFGNEEAPKPKPQVPLANVMAEFEASEGARRAERPLLSLDDGSVLFFEESEHGTWWWTSDKPIWKGPRGQLIRVAITVDEEGDEPSATQRELLTKIQKNLPDLLKTFETRLSKECLEFDPDTSESPAKIESLDDWSVTIEEPSSDEDCDWELTCQARPDRWPCYAGSFMGLKLDDVSGEY